MACIICEHKDLKQIDTDLLNMTPGDADEQLKEIALKYCVSVEALKKHVMCCNSSAPEVNIYGVVTNEKHDSIAKKIKLHEADLLTEVITEYTQTLNLIGRRIRKYAGDDEISLERMLTKSVVDLYLGTGAEIRASVKVLAEMNTDLNGPKNDTASGLVALANAIKDSKE